MGCLGQCPLQMGSHRHLLLPHAERLEPSDHSGGTKLKRPVAVSVDHAEWRDSHSQLDLSSLFRAGLVGNNRQLSDGWRLQAIGLHGLSRRAELHVSIMFLPTAGQVISCAPHEVTCCSVTPYVLLV